MASKMQLGRHQIGALALLLVVLIALESQLSLVKCNLVDLIEDDQVKTDSNDNDNNPLGRLISRFGQQQRLEFQRLAHKANELKNPNTLKDKLGGMFNNAVAPVKNCVTLVNRYHNWLKNYKNLQKHSPHLKDPMDVLKAEYTKVDEELQAEAEAAQTTAAATPDQAEKVEDSDSMGHVIKALKIVIERLEAKLKDLESRQGLVKSGEGFGSSTMEVVHEDKVDEERVKRAMERVKSALMTAGKGLVLGEGAIIARTAVFHALAQYYAAKPDTGDALDQLRPIVALLGSAATPVAMSYLMGLQFRAAIATFNSMNPLQLFDREPKQHLDDEPLREIEATTVTN